MRTKLKYFPIRSTVMAAALAAALSAQAHATGPKVNLFPKAVLNEIKLTTETTKSMEQGLLPIVEKMSSQKKLYDQTHCEGDQSGSSGCGEIFQTISATYVEMLDEMSEALPELRKSVHNSELMLQKRLATELGRKSTPHDMQKNLLQGDLTPVRRTSPVRNKRSMSAIMERNFKRISGAGSSKQSMMAMASDIYLDMRDTSIWIDRLEAQITQQKAMAELNISMGILPAGMEETIEEVVTMVIGEASGDPDEILEDPIVDPVDDDDAFTM